MSKTAKKIVLCEDDPAIARVLENNLRFEGFEVTVVSSWRGPQGLQSLLYRAGQTGNYPDLILMDNNLGPKEPQGLDLLKIIKADPQNRHIPIIMLTAREESHYQKAGHERGAAAYLLKRDPWETNFKMIQWVLSEAGKSSKGPDRLTLDNP